MDLNHPKHMAQSVITWICLTVLIAIGVFAIFPLPDYPRPKARQISCASNMKQIGLALLQYSQDNDEQLPPRQLREADGANVSWRVLIYPDMKDAALFRCPSNPVADSKSGMANDSITDSDFSRSYAVNSASDNARSFGPFSGKFPNGFPLRDAAHPESLLAVVESTAAYSDFNVLAPEIFRWPASEKSKTGNLFCGHQGRTNVLYCDGHVKIIRPAASLDALNGRPNPWTTDGAPFSPADRAKAAQVIEYGAKQYPS
ncbi:hypothetical protein CCAX7_17280 [Capsulimonas corticalis]|uniref:Uncharacterized protein n=1 Tax=Capsulimonas corticalis TaxID=2219043 RepID=A0A402D400_9BACT|nr:DUF1559 domain-containing protein [Capsulimonas corticalis]BDI29677.1 hypothetical protein CCAX7_17280 [Capsulimonas corticalis]